MVNLPPGSGTVGDHNAGQNLSQQIQPPPWAADMQAMQDQMRTMMIAFNQPMASVAQGSSVPNITGWGPPLQQQKGGIGFPAAQPSTSGQTPAGQFLIGSSKMAMPTLGQPAGPAMPVPLPGAPPSVLATAVAGSLPAAPTHPSVGVQEHTVRAHHSIPIASVGVIPWTAIIP